MMSVCVLLWLVLGGGGVLFCQLPVMQHCPNQLNRGGLSAKERPNSQLPVDIKTKLSSNATSRVNLHRNKDS